MRKKPDIWAAAINLLGLWHDKPIKLKYNYNLNEWYDSKGNLSTHKLGYEDCGNLQVFTSKNRKDVTLFILGAQSMSQQVRNIIH